MKDLIPIYCQEYCPLNKHCKFGDAYPDSLPIHESHKCRFKKALHAYLWVKTEPKMSLPCTITMFSALLPACSEAAP